MDKYCPGCGFAENANKVSSKLTGHVTVMVLWRSSVGGEKEAFFMIPRRGRE